MTEQAISGTIDSFDHEKGFGTLTTEDGRTLRFDVGICRFGDPRAGEPVRFAIGPSRLGGERVVWVERPETRRVARASAPPPSGVHQISDGILLEMLAQASGPVRLLLEELVQRRAAQHRVQMHLVALLERATSAASPDVRLIATELSKLLDDLKTV